MLTRQNAKAYAVLSILTDLADDGEQILTEGYVNGREQGFCVSLVRNEKLMRKRAAFSENRNSDQIVVYVGAYHDFSMQGNTPTDNIYKSATYFRPNEYLLAAEFVYNQLTSNI